MVKCNVVSALPRDDTLECSSVEGQSDFFKLRSTLENCGSVRRRCHFEASSRVVCVMFVFTLTLIPAVMVVLCFGRERACHQAERQVFSRTSEWEERVGLCTTELVMFEVAMECHRNRPLDSQCRTS